jgi:carboxylesterase type B
MAPSSTVRVLTGSNKDETTLWSTGETSREKLERTVAGYQAVEALAVYQHTRPEASSHDLLVALTTDHMFRIPAIRLAGGTTRGGANLYVSIQLAITSFEWRVSSHPLTGNSICVQ